MLNYRKGDNVHEELTREDIPIENLPKDFVWMQVKGGTKVTNVVSHASNVLLNERRAIVWTGCGSGGIGRSISCAEMVKRDIPDLHQVTRLGYQLSKEFWEPIKSGLDRIAASRQIPCIHILQSVSPIDADTLGHQVGQTDFWEVAAESKHPTNPRSKRGVNK